MTGAGGSLAAVNLHATTVALGVRGLIIQGPSGSGKSALALQMMAFGAALVADDRTEIRRIGTGLVAACPPELSGLIEARGAGILQAEPAGPVTLAAAVELGLGESARPPPVRMTEILGHAIPLLRDPGTGHFAALLIQYLKGGRVQ